MTRYILNTNSDPKPGMVHRGTDPRCPDATTYDGAPGWREARNWDNLEIASIEDGKPGRAAPMCRTCANIERRLGM